MLFRYRLAQGHHIPRPETIDPIFEERGGRRGTLETLELPHPGTAGSATRMNERHYRLEDRFGRSLLSFQWPRGLLHPCHWHRIGIPMERSHLAYMAHLLRAQPVQRFAPDALRDPAAWIRAIQGGPFMLAMTLRPGGRVEGSTSAYHFVVIHHVRQTLDGSSSSVQVRFLDPAGNAAPSDYFNIPAFASSVATSQVGAHAALHYRGGHAQTAEYEEYEDF